MRHLLVKLGHKRSILIVTVIAIILSVSISTVIRILQDLPLGHNLIISIVAPLIIAPILSWTHVKLLIEIDFLERKMRRLATVDPLTTLFNRRHFLELSEKLMAMSARYQHPFTLLMVDIDHFKQINDTYGHPGGDCVLENLGELIHATIRESDLAGRFGGEEFIFLLPKSNLQGGKIAARRLLEEVRQQTIKHQKQQIQYTISIGGAVYDPQKDETIDQMIQRADQALYKAKEEGRNRVIFL